jgi:hypothetical protein
MYFWAVTSAPLATLAQIACNLPAVSNIMAETCTKVSLNVNIIANTPNLAILIAIFGAILLIIGIIISTTGKKGGSWGNRYHYRGDSFI